MMKTPPKRIWLQFYGEGTPMRPALEVDGVTWCVDKIFPSDVEYVRVQKDKKRKKRKKRGCDVR
jgi:hypothetical protein